MQRTRTKNFAMTCSQVLYDRFNGDIEPGTKAVEFNPRHARRKTDVLIATQRRKYSRFTTVGNEQQVTGISFHSRTERGHELPEATL